MAVLQYRYSMDPTVMTRVGWELLRRTAVRHCLFLVFPLPSWLRHCLFLVCYTAFVAKTLPFPCVFHCLQAKTLPLPCVFPLPFVAKTLPLPCCHQNFHTRFGKPTDPSQTLHDGKISHMDSPFRFRTTEQRVTDSVGNG